MGGHIISSSGDEPLYAKYVGSGDADDPVCATVADGLSGRSAGAFSSGASARPPCVPTID